MTETVSSAVETPEPASGEVIYRHKITTRVTHWINAVCFTVLLMNGLQILNAHPALYWNEFGADDDRAFIEFFASRDGDELVGHTRIGALTMTTTGLFGVSKGNDGDARLGNAAEIS
jgi:hypothetical protein